MKYDVVIVASGKGQRANLGYNKAFYKMKDNKTVLEHSASLFVEDKDCVNIIIVTNEEYFSSVFNNEKNILTTGGKERNDSVRNGLKKVESEYVLIHDAARPYLNKESLDEVKKAVEEHKAAILAKKSIDTIKVVKDGVIVNTLDRNFVYMAETPQAFETKLLKECHEKCKDMIYTDDASILESLGYDVYVVESKFNNKKLTVEADFLDL